MLSFTPLFLLFTSPFIVGEFPHTYGVIGVVLTVTGSYLLNINLRTKSFLSPFKALWTNKGTRYMLIVAFMWSISANYDKVALKNSSVIQYTFFLNLFVQAGITLIILRKKRFALPKTKDGMVNLLLVGALSAVSTIFHLIGVTLTLVTYIVALKRTSGMMSIILGHYVLKEPNIRERFLGAAIMFLGVAFILLS
jgi:drug/metabolite transporter (DMT)-like permease